MKRYHHQKIRKPNHEELFHLDWFILSAFAVPQKVILLWATLLAICILPGNAIANTIYTFTNAGATGRLGPDQDKVDVNYSGTTLEGKVSINTQGIQEWFVPVSGTYRIEVWGAGETAKSSGKGAHLRGDFDMTANTTLKIAVGQMGEAPGGGHGGTFIGTITNQPIIVAGGGAGVTNFISNLSNGSIDQNGSDGNLGRGGNNGQGGHSTEFSSYGGGGGGGFDSNGTAGTNYSGKGVAFVFGALGGTANSSASSSQRKNGGFGGGGAGYATNEPAGGGGFSGGGGGGYAGKGQINGQDRFAGGGGSFNSGNNQINVAGANSGHGKVVITLIQSTSAPPVITQGVGPLTKTISESETASWLASELNVTDEDTNASFLTWSVSSAASNGTATVSGNGSSPSTFTYAPNVDFNGSDSFVVQVSDGDQNDSIMVNVTVSSSNSSPVANNTIYTFTNANATGRLGPTQAQVNSAYSGTTLAEKVTINIQGIQEWQIPQSGLYLIETWGAAGGRGHTSHNLDPGNGAYLRGKFTLSNGELIKILVGQSGQDATADGGGGGGGGSFVVKGTTALIIAGGGGGGGGRVNQHGVDANLLISGTQSANNTGTPGQSGQGGSGGGESWGSGGGGGFLGNGGNGGNPSTGGLSFSNGATGGLTKPNYPAFGGFGGGGGVAYSGGGGGGYSGGAGGPNGEPYAAGGGGGSFNSGIDQNNTTGVTQGHGKVTITFLQTASTVTPGIIQGSDHLSKNILEDGTAHWSTSDLNATDTDTNASLLTWSVSSAASNGTATVSGNGISPSTFTYSPDPNFNGSDTFVVQVSDGEHNDTITVNVTVTAVDDPPVVLNPLTNLSISEDASNTTRNLEYVFSDVDNDNSSITKVASSSDSSLVAATISGNALTLDYQDDRSGMATITVIASSNGKTTTDSFLVQVSQVNDPPEVKSPLADLFNNEDSGDSTINLTNIFSDIDHNQSQSKVAHFKFDGNLSDEVNGDMGVASMTPIYGEGRHGSALWFDGVDDKLTISASDLPMGANVRTLTLWAKPVSNSGSGWTATWGTYSTLKGFGIIQWGGGWRGYGHGADTGHKTPSGGWDHVAVSYDGTTIRLFVDGNQIDTKQADLQTEGEHFVLGQSPIGKWKGWLDEVRVYNRALSGQNISDIMNGEESNLTIVKTATSSNPSLVSTTVNGNVMTLDYQANQSGTATITVTGTSDGQSVSDVFSVTVAAVDDPPVVANAIADLNLAEDAVAANIDLANLFNDIDDDNASIIKTATSSNASLVSATVNGNALTLDFQTNQSGTATITVTGTSNGRFVSDELSVTVVAVDDAPVIANALPDLNLAEDAADANIDLANVFDDIDDDNASITKKATSSHASLVSATVNGNALTLDFKANKSGTATITVTGTSNGQSVSDAFSVSVATVDDAPVVANPLADLNLAEDAADANIDLANVFDDIDDDNASITKKATSSNASLVSVTVNRNTLTLDFQANKSGTATINVTGTSNGKSVSDAFAVTVTAINDAPVNLSLSSDEVTENEPASTIVGNFSATDVDGNATLAFSLVNGSGSVDNSRFTLSSDGLLKAEESLDYEAGSSLSIRVRVTDEEGANYDKPFGISVTNVVEDLDKDGIENAFDTDDDGDGFSDAEEIAYGSDPMDAASVANQAPSGIALDNSDVIENSPAGTKIGDFLVSDPDDNNDSGAYVVALVPGNGSTDNILFAVGTDGSLRTAAVLDFEANIEHSIRVRVSDEHNASLETVLEISATNSFAPIVRTLPAAANENGIITLGGTVLSDGNTPVTSVGVQTSDNLRFEDAVSLVATQSANFSVEASSLLTGTRYYVRAFATNAEGTTFGAIKRFYTQEQTSSPAPWWSDAKESAGGWRESDWFGTFIPYDNGWLYHVDLGWLYVVQDGTSGLWAWKKNSGWHWTAPGVFPHLYRHDTKQWLYFLSSKEGQPYFYNHATGFVE